MTNAHIKVAILFSCILTSIISCNEHKKENILIDKALSKNLMFSNEYIFQNTSKMIQTFRNHSNDPAVSEKTNPMLENMELARKITESTIAYLEELKRSLKIEAGVKLIDGKEVFKEEDFKAVTNLFENKKKGIELYEHLIKYQSSIHQINPELFVSLKSPNYFFDLFSIQKEKLDNEFTTIYFDNINTVSALALITKFQNDVRFYENRAVSFFFTKVAIDRPVMGR